MAVLDAAEHRWWCRCPACGAVFMAPVAGDALALAGTAFLGSGCVCPRCGITMAVTEKNLFYGPRPCDPPTGRIKPYVPSPPG
ncbi:MAG: hypothetical protein JW909_13035 [Planctomycetes bacterium]|nr:hypothetical protein [Planctomycetota bacterium]